ncbi:hypothetical protein PFISCL1PPCAC_14780 [Pristionchus fissidentatus]|uniref:Serpentine receptor class gamma n=1 Tax=Pristionchus fissidentatus TaxID=1538716 RepID=A0AAV5VYN6_9BILA|nr:hypothetical protein PFISCL1PPCAC_14780 [Pristionchus fissidentatus]
MHIRTWIFIIETIFIIPPTLLYIIEICILLFNRNDEFNSPFYTLFVVCGITDILGLFLSQIFYALPMAPDIADLFVANIPKWSFATANPFLFYLPVLQDFLNISIAINRLSSAYIQFNFPVGSDNPPIYLLYPFTAQTFPMLFFFLNPSSPYIGYAIQFLPWVFILKCLPPPILLLYTNHSMRARIL